MEKNKQTNQIHHRFSYLLTFYFFYLVDVVVVCCLLCIFFVVVLLTSNSWNSSEKRFIHALYNFFSVVGVVVVVKQWDYICYIYFVFIFVVVEIWFWYWDILLIGFLWKLSCFFFLEVCLFSILLLLLRDVFFFRCYKGLNNFQKCKSIWSLFHTLTSSQCW